MSEDYADLFCELFDRLDPAQFHAEGEAWMADAKVAATAAAVEQAALDGEPVAAPEGGRQTFAVLLGLDAALAHANPLLGGAAPPALTEYALRYAESGRLDSGALPGALLPRFARPGRRGQLPDDLADAFGSVVRVDSAGWDACDHAALPARSRLTRPEREAGLRVATAPMIREPDELEWEVEERSGLRFYRIHPADREPTRTRVEKVIAAWDEQDVAIGIAPELCLSRALLERWQVALREREGAGTSRLRLVVAGSGNVDGSSPPANEAVLLDARTGEVLVRQRKVHPFNFSHAGPGAVGAGRSPDRSDRRGPEPRRASVRGGSGRRPAGDPGVRGPGSVTRVRRGPSRPWGVAAPGAGVRSADQGPALGARAGRGLQRRHRLERRGGQQPGDR